jgi:hypothetical protein
MSAATLDSTAYGPLIHSSPAAGEPAAIPLPWQHTRTHSSATAAVARRTASSSRRFPARGVVAHSPAAARSAATSASRAARSSVSAVSMVRRALPR